MIKSAPTTPLSPVTPVTSATPATHAVTSPFANLVFGLQQIYSEYKENEEVFSVLKEIGLYDATKITNSLQGGVWRAFQNQKQNMKSVIIKITDKSLSERSRAIVDNQEFRVCEDISNEYKILNYIAHQNDCPHSIVKCSNFFQTNKYLCLLMEDGGGSLFDFVAKAHRCIATKNLDRSEWNKVLKIMFKQMLESVVYIHSHNVAHFDISLENFVINDLKIEVDEYEDTSKPWKMRFGSDDIRVKLCDFGLAEKFESKACESNKFCGKRPYKSPEIVYGQKGFDAKKNDIWCLGVCWLAMSIGFIPWDIAHESDNVFSYFLEHSVSQLLEHWNISRYVDSRLICLFDSIFQDEDHRMDLTQIKEYMHQFIFNA